MTHLSLCSGIGGIDLAAEWSGFRTVATCEIDPFCRIELTKNFPDAYQFTDVKDVSAESIRAAGIQRPTLISAGFPCQPFSVAGKREGSSDERHLWPEIARILREIRPRWFLGENVRGLLSISHGRVFGAVLADLANLGYRVGWGCFGADEAAGASHRRDRVFIVGYLADAQGPNVGRPGNIDAEAGDGRQDFERGSGTVGNPQVWPVGGLQQCGMGSGAKADPERQADHHQHQRSSAELGHATGRRFGIGGNAALPGGGRHIDCPDGYLADSEGERREGRGLPVFSGQPRSACTNPHRGRAKLADPINVRGQRPGTCGAGDAESAYRGGSVEYALGSRQAARRGQSQQSERGQCLPPLGCPRFPPGPADFDTWARVLEQRPDLAPALTPEEEAELEIRPVAHGISRRMALKMLGNAVVPYQVYPILAEIAAFERGHP